LKVLVTTYRTASDRIALAAVRGLSQAGHEPWIGTDDPSAPSCSSRHCRGICEVPNPIPDADGHARRVNELIHERCFETVMPADDYAVFALSRASEAAGLSVPIPVPSLAAQQQAQDKGISTKIAASLGLHTPLTRTVQTVEELTLALTEIPPPWVVKLTRGGGSVGLQISDSAKAVHDYFQNRPRYRDAIYDFDSLIVQSFIPGIVQDVLVLMNKGRAVCGLASRRRLSWPAGCGSGILVETTARPAFFDAAVSLLEELNWHGPADVEFLIDDRDGNAYFIEINGRLWGTTALAIAAEVNFPALSCEMALKGDTSPNFSFPEGIQMRFPFPLGPFFVAASSAKLAAAWKLFGPSPGIVSDVWWSDLSPTFMHVRQAWEGLRNLNGPRTLSPLSMINDRTGH
jgi:predicted ATP-grasp superfamily ATP-dependent carboligase